MTLTGKNFIAGERVSSAEQFNAKDATTGEFLEPPFAIASDADVAEACCKADAAFDEFKDMPAQARATFIDAIADTIADTGDDIIDRAQKETALPRPRLEGERGRTVGQLKMFANQLRTDDVHDKRTIASDPNRAPIPQPKLDFRRVGIGPVAIFGASNFPLAFSVAGGDTASALAAGCPVVVKGHPAHPGVSEYVAKAILNVIEQFKLPAGIFSLVHGGIETGQALVRNDYIKAVGFTGSRRGGKAIIDLAAQRLEPIPVYAEMSSINPVIFAPGALAQRAESLAEAFVGSLTLGVGQFCTNPGLIIAIEGNDFDRFKASAISALSQVTPVPMLTQEIKLNFERCVSALRNNAAVSEVSSDNDSTDSKGASGVLFETTAHAFINDRTLQDEVFGPAAVIVRCKDEEEVAAIMKAIEGQLTASLHLQEQDEDDISFASALRPVLERKVGRLIVNGWPTGVEVSPAMVHGGPYPATSDVRTSSVGTIAIERFLRPVCYQDFPSALLPETFRT
ncbi:MAG: aldehyde dehydrogenase (NADP(+)) [Pseudomonadota bacterium]